MTGRLVVVTGGSRGIGRAIVLRLAAVGHRVVAVGRDEAALAETRSLAIASGGDIATLTCDVTDEGQVSAAFAQLADVEILVNNAGVASSAALAETTLTDWQGHLAVNVTSAFLCTRAALPAMCRRDWGRIICVASTAARVGTRYTAAYTASKHALLGLTRAVAAECAGTGVTSNAVCPTFVRTELTQQAVDRIVVRTGRDPSDAEAALAAASPLGRLLDPSEVAAAVGYLTSEEAGCVNGQAIVLDGGGVQA